MKMGNNRLTTRIVDEDDLDSCEEYKPLISHDEDDTDASKYSIFTPKYPHMNCRYTRIKSFDAARNLFKQSITEMAENGLFYLCKDFVVCYQCGIKLTDWQDWDIPMIEHSRWSPKCPIVKPMSMNDKIDLIVTQLLRTKT